MKKHFYLIIIAAFSIFSTANANVGDTTWVQCFNGQLTHPGNFDTAVVFPNGSTTYRKIYLVFTMGEYNCPAGSTYCHQWDYTVDNIVMTPRGDTFELARFISPYATGGTPGFGSTWQQHYIFDITDFYNVLQDSGTMRIDYSGYSYGFTGSVQLAFIEGTPERNVVGQTHLWDNYYYYGNPSSPIDSNVRPYSLTAPGNAASSELKLIITGHGADSANTCCEFSDNGMTYYYDVLANNASIVHQGMNMNCGWSELYPQGGTWLSYRAGNWCPGGLVSLAQYKLPVTAGSPYTIDIGFDDSYYGGNSFGGYAIAASMFYYGNFNKTLDASLEDVIAPTSFEWYRRENPRASVPVVKVRNTGSTAITSILFQYGVKDSSMFQYIWNGSIAPLTDTTIALPPLTAITNLSLNGATGSYGFIAEIQQVNGQTDNDQSNDTITSHFTVAPTWPPTFLVKMKTSTISANGNLGQNPADASWQITDPYGNIVASRTNANVATTYDDTVTLNNASYYILTVSTSQCYGLNWWALANVSGYTPGSFSVVDYSNFGASLPLNGNNGSSGTYHDDFGCGFTQYFTTTGECQSGTPTITSRGDTLIASPGASYQWYNNGVLIPGATNSTYGVNNSNGNFSVQVTDGNGCVGTSGTFAVANLGLTKMYDQAYVAIMPNPANEAFTLTVNNEVIGSTYTVSDMTGRNIISGNVNATSTFVSTATLSPGIYLVSVTDGTSSIVKRIAVAR